VRRLVLSLACGAVLASCSVELPEPDSPGARVLAARCGGCHRLYAPSSMTIAMWDLQLGRMRGLFAQRGIPWLSPAEEQALRDYLAAHAGTQ
jgi:hypothetical protein